MSGCKLFRLHAMTIQEDEYWAKFEEIAYQDLAESYLELWEDNLNFDGYYGEVEEEIEEEEIEVRRG